jgi:alanine-synthesizing transaminase
LRLFKSLNEKSEQQGSEGREKFRAIGWNVPSPQAGMYIWPRIPSKFRDSATFARELAERTGVILSPGNGFGKYGEGYVRFALVENTQRINQAIRGLRKVLMP